MEFFKEIKKINYEGKDSKNDLAFKYYNPDEIIMGKSMKEHLRFAMSYWHTLTAIGNDPFGEGTIIREWDSLNPMEKAKARVKAGIDIGGTNTRIALIDDSYNIIKRIQFNTDYDEPLRTLHKINETIQSFNEKIIGIGLSCPGPLDLINGKILNTPNLGVKWHDFLICEELSKITNVPVYLENDANLACLAESIIGEGKEYNYVQFLTISTGVGSGFVLNKQIYNGSHGFAHEIANVPLWRNGPTHGSIYPGGIEAISSGTAITLRAKQKGLQVSHAGDVFSLANQGNTDAQSIVEDAVEYLSNLIAIIYAFIDPEIVILGGSVALKTEGFAVEIEERVKTKVFPNLKDKIKVVNTTLNEDSGLLGAACLAFQKLF